MARAKRFDRDRAEARRRYRASQAGAHAAVDDGEIDDLEGSEAGATAAVATATSSAPAARTGPRRTTGRAGGAAAQPQGRMGLGQAFRAAFRPANFPEDLRALPKLLLHRAAWIPIALSAASVVAFIVTGPANPITSFAFNTFGLPPALAAVFICGFFIPRASYLVAGIVATLASVFYSIFLVVAAQGVVPGVPAISADRLPGEIASAFAIGPVSGVVFGAAAAWYRRFLYLTSPARSGARGGQGANRRTTANRSGSRRR